LGLLVGLILLVMAKRKSDPNAREENTLFLLRKMKQRGPKREERWRETQEEQTRPRFPDGGVGSVLTLKTILRSWSASFQG
jgi:hypothetical protein